MLELRNVSKRFAASLAVDGVSFRARRGEVTGYLGPNGSGKSTTMKMIAGLIDTTAGEIPFDDRLLLGNWLRAADRTAPEDAARPAAGSRRRRRLA